MTRSSSLLSGGTLVATGMVGMNVAVYGLTIVAARSLEPRDLGALTALLGVLLMGNVMSLGLQASSARRLSVHPEDRAVIIGTVARVAPMLAVGTGVFVGLVTVALAEPLRLPSLWPAVLTGATLVPLTMMGAAAGVAQGTERWGMLTAIYLGGGLGRLVFGVGALLIETSVTSAMIGIAIGAWVPVLVGLPLLRGRSADARTTSRRSYVREAVLGSHALLAYFVLSNLDALLARIVLDPHDSGLYASGLILSKAAVFFPQFVSIVVFPLLARDETSRSRHLAAGAVAGLGAAAVLVTALLPQVALILVGGDRYAEVAGRLWLFALAGSCLAVVHLLVYDALARHAHGVAAAVWTAVATLATAVLLLDLDITGLVITVAAVAATLAVVVMVAPSPSAAPDPATGRVQY